MATSTRVMGSCALLVAMMMMALTPTAHAGAVFEIKKPILDPASAYKIPFPGAGGDLPYNVPGRLVAGTTPFNATAIPLFNIKLAKCTAVTVHFHPLATETAYVISGSIEIGMFFEDQKLRVVQASAGEAILVPQGTVHYVKNTHNGPTELLALFDHPQGGTQIVGAALLGQPMDILQSAFTGSLPTGITGVIFPLKNCKY